MYTRNPHRAVRISAVTLLALATAAGTLTPAQAGPDDSTSTQSEKSSLQLTESVEAERIYPAPVPAEPAPAPAPETGLKQCVAGDFTGKYPLAKGHVDIKATLTRDTFTLGLKDDTALLNRQSTIRPLNDVVLTVNDNALTRKTDRLNRPELAFLGKTGDTFYLLPQTQNQGIIWPGYNTESVDFSQLDGPVSLHLEPVKIPDGANYGLYSDRFGGTDLLIDSTKKQTSLDISFATHVHTNWAFTKPGNYSFRVYYSATHKDGTRLKTPAQQLSFAVGKQAVAECLEGIEAQRFTDVKPGDLFYREIQWLAGQKISTGWSDGTYRPVQPVERAAMAAFFYRMSGSPNFVPPAVSPFRDVPISHQFYKEITWLHSQKITTGWEDGTFRPDQPINRDAIAAFFYRHAGSPAYTAPSASAFKDINPGDQFYREVSWLAAQGITTGWEDGTFRPLNSVNRDAMAAFIYRYKH